MIRRICPFALVAALLVGGCYSWDRQWPAPDGPAPVDLPAPPDGTAPDQAFDLATPDAPIPDLPFTRPGNWVTIQIAPIGVSFTMGSSSGDCVIGQDAAHKVTLTHSFEIMDAEVTQADYKYVLNDEPSSFPTCGTNCPMGGASWHMAAAYCNELSRRTQHEECYTCSGSGKDLTVCDQRPQFLGDKIYDCKGYRLPTEAEWEYACRGGSGSDYHAGFDLSTQDCKACESIPDLVQMAWYCSNATGTTHPVRSKPVNKFGLYGMAGNVSEWCNDWFNDAALPNATDPGGPNSGTQRVRRGGSYENLPQYLKSSRRDREDPVKGDDGQGFRCVILK